MLAFVLIVCGMSTWLYVRALDIGRTDAFSSLGDGRPVKEVEGSFNILLLGSDSRDPENRDEEARTDTIMMLHVNKAHDAAALISVPRDLYVHVPKNPSGGEGDTDAKINAAFAWGGSPLMVATIEEMTRVRIDHVALIDFDGLRSVVDALGGVDMMVEEDTTSIHGNQRFWPRGMNHFSGDAALDYIRQRKQFTEGDFARIRHQQQFLRAMLDKAADSGTLTSPFKLKSFVDSLSAAMVVDQDFKIVDMAVQFRNLRSSNLTFLTSPNLGDDFQGGESVILPDQERSRKMYDAVNKDRLAAWIKANPPKN